MTSVLFLSFYGVVIYGLLGAVLLAIPKFWRPELPFGVSVPYEGTEEIRESALRYWRVRVAALTVAVIICAAILPVFKAQMWVVQVLVIPYFALCIEAYQRARRMLLPLARPSKKIGAALRRRRYRDYVNPWWEMIPAGLFAIGIVLLLIVHTTRGQASGLTPARRFAILCRCLFPALVVYPVLLVSSVLAAYSKQNVSASHPDVSLTANEAFRKAWLRYFYALRVVLAAIFVLLYVCFILAMRGVKAPVMALPFAIFGFVFAGVGAGIILGVWYGQGGWKWAVRKGLVSADEAPALLDGDGMADDRWKLGIFYFNPSDPSVMVEMRFNVGWTFNFGSVWGLALALATFGMFVVPALLRLLTR